jgi:hypothetical protein
MRKMNLFKAILGIVFLAGIARAESGVIPVLSSDRQGIGEAPLSVTEDVIAYDDNPSIYLNNLTEPGTLFDVRFTPFDACSLVAVDVVTYLGAGDGIIHVYADSGGAAGNDLMTPITVSLWGNLTRQRINLPLPVDIDSADFHVALEYAQAPPPYAALDNNGGSGRSSHREPGGDWIVISAHDLNIRAYVNYYAVDNEPPEIGCMPRVLAFSIEESYEISAEITDPSGVRDASVFYSLDSLNYLELDMVNISGDTWTVEIPSQPVGSTIYYYIEAFDNSQNQNTGMLPEDGPDDPFILQITDGYEIAYDDGTPESFWVVGSTWDNNKFGLRVTPAEYPLRLTGARVLVDDATSFNITINEDNSGMPGSIITGPYEISRNAEDWAILFIPEGQQPQIDQGDFWLVFHWRVSSPASPGVGVDTNSPDLRSRRYTDTGGWINVTGADFIMRVFGVSLTSGADENRETNTIPFRLQIIGNFPNPFNSETEIRFLAPSAGYVELGIFDLAGRKVKTLYDENIRAGENFIIWSGADDFGNPVSSGVYFYQLRVQQGARTGKMLLLK